MIPLGRHDRGLVLAVRAQPGARKNAIKGVQAGALKVAVTQAAEKGKANQALADLLGAALNLRSSQVALLSGATARQKQFLIEGLSEGELRARLRPWDAAPS